MYTWNPYNNSGKSNIVATPVDVITPKLVAPLSPRSSQGISDGDSFPSFCEPSPVSALDEEALDVYMKLRHSKKDSSVLNNMKRLPKKMKERVCRLLATSPTLVRENCIEQRGNTVSAAMNICNDDDRNAIVNAVLDDAIAICCTKAGCIAMCRVYDAVPSEQQAALAVVVMKQFIALSIHEFGNYVVQHLLRQSVSVTRMICFSAAISALDEPNGMTNIACNKFGSHVLEVVFLQANDESFMELFLRVVQDSMTVSFLVHNSFANYALQCAFRRVVTIDPELKGYCASVVHPFLTTSAHAKNIMLALSSE